MKQEELTSIFCEQPQSFMWFLGAGVSRTAGLPTATDVTWDMKRRYYCREENQEITRQDIQSEAVREKIQSFMDSRGFPSLWAEDEYEVYFEKIFGEDLERQRRYLSKLLSEERVSLSVGQRILGAMMAANLCKVGFTTNFDSVIEKALAEVAGRSLSAYHLEGSESASAALNNEEYPFYCKLHGDFRYQSLKNLPSDLAKQNEALSDCFVTAGNRFGCVVTGYSGRDRSVMALFDRVLTSHNPFPHGLFWTGIKGASLHPAVESLLERATERGIRAHYVEIETFDVLMLRLWRSIDQKPRDLDAKVRRSAIAHADIPLPPAGTNRPLMRLNALPILALPTQCHAVTLKRDKSWTEISEIVNASSHELIFTKADTVWCWGTEEQIRDTFGDNLAALSQRDLPADLRAAENLHVKGFVEKALCRALAHDRPLLVRWHHGVHYLIANPNASDTAPLASLKTAARGVTGTIPGLFSAPSEQQPRSVPVKWAEALRVSVEHAGDSTLLLIDPDIWVWPRQSRRDAVDFLDRRRADRRNDKYNALLDAWVQILFHGSASAQEITAKPFDSGSEIDNPSFRIARRTAFARRRAA